MPVQPADSKKLGSIHVKRNVVFSKWSPKNQFFSVIRDTGDVLLFRITSELLWTYNVDGARAVTLAWSPDEMMIAVCFEPISSDSNHMPYISMLLTASGHLGPNSVSLPCKMRSMYWLKHVVDDVDEDSIEGRATRSMNQFYSREAARHAGVLPENNYSFLFCLGDNRLLVLAQGFVPIINLTLTAFRGELYSLVAELENTTLICRWVSLSPTNKSGSTGTVRFSDWTRESSELTRLRLYCCCFHSLFITASKQCAKMAEITSENPSYLDTKLKEFNKRLLKYNSDAAQEFLMALVADYISPEMEKFILHDINWSKVDIVKDPQAKVLSESWAQTFFDTCDIWDLLLLPINDLDFFLESAVSLPSSVRSTFLPARDTFMLLYLKHYQSILYAGYMRQRRAPFLRWLNSMASAIEDLSNSIKKHFLLKEHMHEVSSFILNELAEIVSDSPSATPKTSEATLFRRSSKVSGWAQELQERITDTLRICYQSPSVDLVYGDSTSKLLKELASRLALFESCIITCLSSPAIKSWGSFQTLAKPTTTIPPVFHDGSALLLWISSEPDQLDISLVNHSSNKTSSASYLFLSPSDDATPCSILDSSATDFHHVAVLLASACADSPVFYVCLLDLSEMDSADWFHQSLDTDSDPVARVPTRLHLNKMSLFDISRLTTNPCSLIPSGDGKVVVFDSSRWAYFFDFSLPSTD